jgi:hypothetical protein
MVESALGKRTAAQREEDDPVALDKLMEISTRSFTRTNKEMETVVLGSLNNVLDLQGDNPIEVSRGVIDHPIPDLGELERAWIPMGSTIDRTTWPESNDILWKRQRFKNVRLDAWLALIHCRYRAMSTHIRQLETGQDKITGLGELVRELNTTMNACDIKSKFHSGLVEHMLLPLKEQPDDLMDKLVTAENAALMLYQINASYLEVLQKWTKLMSQSKLISDSSEWTKQLVKEKNALEGAKAVLSMIRCQAGVGPQVLTKNGMGHSWEPVSRDT